MRELDYKSLLHCVSSTAGSLARPGLEPFRIAEATKHGHRFYIHFTNGVFVTTVPGGQLDIAAIFVFFPPKHGIVTLPIRIDDFSLPDNAPLDDYLPPPAHNLDTDRVHEIFVHPALDLLILLKIGRHIPGKLSYDLHLRSLKSAGRLVYPICTFAVIHDTFHETPDGTPGALIRVLGDLVALRVSNRFKNHVSVWSWVTGEKITRAYDNTPCDIHDLTFVPPDVLVASVSSHDNRLYSVTIWIYSLKADDLARPETPRSEPQSVPLMLPPVLHLPTFGDQDMTLVSMICMADSPVDYLSEGHHLSMPPAVAFNLRTSRQGVPFGIFDKLWTLMVVRGDALSLTSANKHISRTFSTYKLAILEGMGPNAYKALCAESYRLAMLDLSQPKVTLFPCVHHIRLCRVLNSAQMQDDFKRTHYHPSRNRVSHQRAWTTRTCRFSMSALRGTG
ncbi:hypothetical protein EVG20_g6392 [Dentipellis fragilis]|uniref:Uncharacterized protein n=1 Tax=Dentipellis fragilis TaxID=205917 RepID=A0A4Y9YMV4_9AGAM|nr:hypothetical protein EVG20_g6392 [Dentipellis fragilis]